MIPMMVPKTSLSHTMPCPMQTKELHEIRVSDICKQCGLNRSTFYVNYDDRHLIELYDESLA